MRADHKQAMKLVEDIEVVDIFAWVGGEVGRGQVVVGDEGSGKGDEATVVANGKVDPEGVGVGGGEGGVEEAGFVFGECDS
jgi:hypothetical protein